MVKRKPVAPPKPSMPQYPTMPTLPPPPAPTQSMVSPVAAPPYPTTPSFITPPAPPPTPPTTTFNNNNNQHVLDATEEWDNQEDDDGSDWWDHSDDENDNRNPRNLVASDTPSKRTPQYDLLDLSPTLKANHETRDIRDSEHPVLDMSTGVIPMDVALNHPRSMDKNHNNPFFRRQSNHSTEPEPESTASIWQENQPKFNGAAPQLPMPVFPKEPLSPKLFDGWADGHIVKPSSSNPPIPMPEPENPWHGISGSSDKAKITTPRKSLLVRGTSKVLQSSDQISFEGKSAEQVKSRSPLPLQNPHITIPTTPITQPDVSTPQTNARKQRSESYQIKHIRWHDAKSNENPRMSPILTQNANGPCPLLALVNALVLSTPFELITPLVDTLRTRELVSLGLLLDAVFDELMSDRRGEIAHQLPDVGDLYSFLITLHTGMNVNPRFIQSGAMNLNDLRIGAFEETKEMRLYSTFAIPLIHGWLPRPQDESFGAFQRLAQTYEDAQNMGFREAELERKLQAEQLTDEEETLYIDLTSIREFFTVWPTQLTEYGLDTMKESLQPGRFAILFRNDHFSTIYKEPRSNQLMTLVTDAGYATHDEIVWESLVDINGSRSELFAGDFKSVTHYRTEEQDIEDEGQWTTVENRNSRNRRAAGKLPASQSLSLVSNTGFSVEDDASMALQNAGDPCESAPSRPPRPRTASEQEDHDLALALQLQEEEEQALRRQTRKEQDEATQRYLNQESSRRGPEIPVRRSNNSSSGAPPPPLPGPRPPVTTVRNNTDEEAPPPPYEQATAKNTLPFVPPQNHPSSEHAPFRSPGAQSTPNAQTPQSLYSQNTQTFTDGQPTRGQLGARRRGSSRGGPSGMPTHAARGRGAPASQRSPSGSQIRSPEEDEKCNVM